MAKKQGAWADRAVFQGRTLLITVILTLALIGFEIFNYDTTRYALLNLLGGLRFWELEWSSILAFAFCGIDFAGLIRMLTPEQGRDEPKEIWLLTGAWLLGATMNAIMTWYAVSVALDGRTVATSLISQGDMLSYAPIFVALLVWLTRILFIGSLAFTADRLIHVPGWRPGAVRTSGRSLPRGAPLRDANFSGSNGRAVEAFREDFD